ncbi:Transcription antitermination protein NusG [Thermogutta terrifontis]|uniref:Transcription termination/antitermination protein NusG n=1 Tax=Thermogutta terrifontis TaxID=1331910 RepID=A0A286RJN4_9BACT|nr:transcription termination/antitermination protein NusG [Thermogutta terrifontis]ASV76112.1 Transcription antitermination protein NusG [Thermogutta terrifontis]
MKTASEEAPQSAEQPGGTEDRSAEIHEAGQASSKKTRRRGNRENGTGPTADAEGESQKSSRMAWYIVKVQTNREDSACEALKRRIKVAGLDRYFGQIIVPVERITEVKGGKKRVVRRKLYPGYIVVQMELTDDTWFLVRETPGIGDFTGAIGRPTPLLPHEVNRILAKLAEEKAEDAPKLKIGCRVGDRVKINEGHFANFEGEVSAVDEANGRVTVMINIFGRSTPVELEYWQVEPAA